MAAPRLNAASPSLGGGCYKEPANSDKQRATNESLQQFKEDSNRINNKATYLNLMVRGVNLNLFGTLNPKPGGWKVGKNVMGGRTRGRKRVGARKVDKGGVGGGNHNAFGSSSWNVKELRQYLSKHKIPYKRKPKPALLQLVQTHERSAGLGPAGPEATVQLATTDMAWNKVNAR